MDSQQQAQQLFWEVGRLRGQGLHRLADRKLCQMARLHEDLARRLLAERNADGWIDMYAAITAWGEAGRRHDAHRLIAEGVHDSAFFPDGVANVQRQLKELERWLDTLDVVPSLSDFACELPLLSPGVA